MGTGSTHGIGDDEHRAAAWEKIRTGPAQPLEPSSPDRDRLAGPPEMAESGWALVCCRGADVMYDDQLTAYTS